MRTFTIVLAIVAGLWGACLQAGEPASWAYDPDPEVEAVWQQVARVRAQVAQAAREMELRFKPVEVRRLEAAVALQEAELQLRAKRALLSEMPREAAGGSRAPQAAPPAAGQSREAGLGPKPTPPADIVTRAKALMPRIRTASKKADKLQEQAAAARSRGDRDAWSDLLSQAREAYKAARDEWIGIEDELADFLTKNPSKGWDAEMLIDAYLHAEVQEVARLVDDPLAEMAFPGARR